MTNSNDRSLTRLEDEMVEDVLAASDEEIIEELREEGIDIDTFDQEMRNLFDAALAEGGRRRLQNARKTVDLHQERQKREERQDPQIPLQAQIDEIMARSPKLTMAARNLQEQHQGDLKGILEDLQDLENGDWEDGN